MNNCKHEQSVGCQWHSTWIEGNLGPQDVTRYYRGIRCLECQAMIVHSVMPKTTYMMGWEDGDILPVAPAQELNTWWEFQRGERLEYGNYNLPPTENVQ